MLVVSRLKVLVNNLEQTVKFWNCDVKQGEKCGKIEGNEKIVDFFPENDSG